MEAINIVIILMFLLLGITFMRGKGAFLIAGYNTSNKEEKAKYDEKALCRFMGKIMFLFAACFSIVTVGSLLNSATFLRVGLVLFFGVTVFTLIYANTGNRFRK